MKGILALYISLHAWLIGSIYTCLYLSKRKYEDEDENQAAAGIERRTELTIHSPVAGATSGRRRRCMAEAGVQQRREQQVRQQSEPRRQRAHHQ